MAPTNALVKRMLRASKERDLESLLDVASKLTDEVLEALSLADLALTAAALRLSNGDAHREVADAANRIPPILGNRLDETEDARILEISDELLQDAELGVTAIGQMSEELGGRFCSRRERGDLEEALRKKYQLALSEQMQE